jgi:hypothetical protein
MKQPCRYLIIIVLALVASCAPSVTNVWDYYIKNNLENHVAGSSSTSKARLLYRKQEYPGKAQLELVAFKNESRKCLVVGSHKIAKAFYLNDSLYHFDVDNLYSNVRGNDFIRQMGDLSIYFTNIPADRCEAFLAGIDKLKSDFMKAAVSEGSVTYVDFPISSDVFVSFEKKSPTQLADESNIAVWVGKRRHEMKFADLVKAMQDLKSFN